MEFVAIPLVSAAVAALTFVSGFGLGTLLLPAFAVFFPIEVAIAATGVVHLANNLLRVAIVWRWADRGVVLRFGVPAVLAALAGAALMTVMAGAAPIVEYELGPIHARVTALKLVIAVMLAAFAALELRPRYGELSFPRRALPVGGVLSGFFGGICGLQGALRAPFLLRAGLSSRGYVGTAAVISTIVDVARLAVYGAGFTWLARRRDGDVLRDWRTASLVAAACAAGFLGSYLGARIVRKVTLRAVRVVVAALLLVVAAALGAGIV